MRASHRYPSRAAASQAAAEAARKATQRAAQHLLKKRLTELQATRTAPVPAPHVTPEPYVTAVAQLRAAAQKAPQPASAGAPVRTRETASAGYRRALAAHISTIQR